MRGKRLKKANQIAEKHERNFFQGMRNHWEVVTGKFRKTRTFCSDPKCCGNPRRIGKKTRKEQISDIEFDEQLEDYMD